MYRPSIRVIGNYLVVILNTRDNDNKTHVPIKSNLHIISTVFIIPELPVIVLHYCFNYVSGL